MNPNYVNEMEPELIAYTFDIELMAYLDGELSESQTHAVQERLKQNSSEASKISCLKAVSDFVQADANRVYTSMQVDSIADNVMRSITAAEEQGLRLPSEFELDCMAYYDNELSAERSLKVSSELQNNPLLRSTLSSFHAISHFVQADADRLYVQMQADSIVDQVMVRIDSDIPVTANQKVVPLELRQAMSIQTKPASTRGRKVVFWGTFTSLAAAAAGLFFYMQEQRSPEHSMSSVNSNLPNIVKVEPIIAPAGSTTPSFDKKKPDEINDIDMGASIGMVVEELGNATVYLNEDGSPSVILINEDESTKTN